MRHPWVQAVLSWVFYSWLKLCFVTIRWSHENRAAVERVWASGGPVIVLFWHSRVALGPAVWDHSRGQEIRALVSMSPDGEFFARAMEKLGFPAVRGSSMKKTATDKAKGGGAAFRELLRWLKNGGAVAITPDGPRGPAEEMAEGAAMLAKTSGAPVLMFGVACNPAIRLGTWDRSVVPLPFSRGVVVWEDPVIAPRDADLDELRRAWSARLTRVTDRAEELAA
ncbi:lysophospholipid acyltransferase family protein [Caulobacter sp. 17J80-11]|uniref:lysophospholipid acyltransferase family protein n=1 Tax=Caulobacter sp. 17J80-11 TaxID=2763502 RepID=UPI00165348D2|nr:lysophospholipid acyltransferase family protein [Caulobacter sp. 17J80-11]MBC6981035.1 lysophospholipid acyltransferase family protein [Caulobacter sp. 17J80-11]